MSNLDDNCERRKKIERAIMLAQHSIYGLKKDPYIIEVDEPEVETLKFKLKFGYGYDEPIIIDGRELIFKEKNNKVIFKQDETVDFSEEMKQLADSALFNVDDVVSSMHAPGDILGTHAYYSIEGKHLIRQFHCLPAEDPLDVAKWCGGTFIIKDFKSFIEIPKKDGVVLHAHPRDYIVRNVSTGEIQVFSPELFVRRFVPANILDTTEEEN